MEKSKRIKQTNRLMRDEASSRWSVPTRPDKSKGFQRGWPETNGFKIGEEVGFLRQDPKKNVFLAGVIAGVVQVEKDTTMAICVPNKDTVPNSKTAVGVDIDRLWKRYEYGDLTVQKNVASLDAHDERVLNRVINIISSNRDEQMSGEDVGSIANKINNYLTKLFIASTNANPSREQKIIANFLFKFDKDRQYHITLYRINNTYTISTGKLES